MGSLVGIVNFRGPEGNPFSSATDFKRFFPA